MFLSQNNTSDDFSVMTNANSSSGENRSRRSNGQLPYKILRFPTSKCTLWDHGTNGNCEKLHIFNSRILKVNVQRKVVKMGCDFILSEDHSDSLNFTLSGKIVISRDGGEIVLNFDKAHYPELAESKWNSGLIDFYIPLDFSVKSLKKRMQYDKNTATQWLLVAAKQKEAILYRRFIYLISSCQFDKSNDEIFSILQFNALILSTNFLLYSISPVPVIPTALSKGLADPVGNAFLHGEPKSGYITMDETRRILLVLDSDPKVNLLPLIGIWISGIHSAQHPYSWTCCMRYIHNSAIQERICCPPEPFMVLVYEKPKNVPKFYDCIIDPHSLQDTVSVYSGVIKAPVSCDNNFQKSLSIILEKQQLSPPVKDGNMEFTSAKEPDVLVLPEKFLFSTSQSQPHVDDKSLSNSVPRISKQLVQSDSSGSSKHDFRKTSTDKCSCNVNYPVIREEKHDVYEILKLQEQQLKKLKEQLDTLIRERKEILTSASSVNNPSSRDDSKCTGHQKLTNSAGTMTSFVWPSSSHEEGHHMQVEVPDQIDTMSPEVMRRQSVISNMSEDDMLRNFQFPTFHDSVDSSQQSEIVVELPGYSEYLSDLSLAQNTNSLDCSTSDNPSSISNDAISTNAESQIGDDDGSDFYDNLLRRIHTILSKQSPSTVNEQDTNVSHLTMSPSSPHTVLSNERTTFNSLLIPRLNYLSLYSTESDNERSLEFQLLALKYLYKHKDAVLHFNPVLRDKLTTPLVHLRDTKDTNFSFATNQYLKKYGLLTDDGLENPQDQFYS